MPPEPKYEIGERVRVPVRLLLSQDRLTPTPCLGTITGRCWDGDARAGVWAYGVDLDVGGCCRSNEDSIQRLDIVTELGEVAS